MLWVTTALAKGSQCVFERGEFADTSTEFLTLAHRAPTQFGSARALVTPRDICRAVELGPSSFCRFPPSRSNFRLELNRDPALNLGLGVIDVMYTL